jgi:DNA invertase Pin-like site-specific DNA recombinase
MRQFVEARGWKVVAEESDQRTGKDDKRAGYQRIMKLAKGRKVDVLVVHSLDRWARSTKHLVDTLAELEALGVQFVSLREQMDFTTPSGKVMFTVIAAMAQFESALISERVKSGMAQAKRDGKRIGRAPKVVELAVVAKLVKGKKSIWEMSRKLKCSRTAVRTALKTQYKTPNHMVFQPTLNKAPSSQTS